MKHLPEDFSVFSVSVLRTRHKKPRKRRWRQRGEKFDLQEALGKTGIELILIQWQQICTPIFQTPINPQGSWTHI